MQFPVQDVKCKSYAEMLPIPVLSIVKMDIVAQILDYASWVAGLTTRRIHEIAMDKLGQRLEATFSEKYDAPPSETRTSSANSAPRPPLSFWPANTHPTEGRQYIIPGTERIKRQSFKAEGRQLVIPGADPIPQREHLARMVMKPTRPRRHQVGLAGTGLFGRGGRTENRF